MNYDAVALGSKELGFSLDYWKTEARNGLPVLAANVFNKSNVLTYPKPNEPLFQTRQSNRRMDNGQFFIRDDHDLRLGVIGFISSTAWKARKDTTSSLVFESPFEMRDLVQEVAGNCDLLTVLGEFTMQEADSLVKLMPEINLIVASNIRVDQSQREGKAMIVGAQPRGNNGNYLEWNLANRDSTDVLSKAVSLDDGALVDSTIAKMLADVKDKLTGPAPVPAKMVNPPQKPSAPPPPAAPPKPKTATASITPPTNPPPPVPPVDPDGTKQ